MNSWPRRFEDFLVDSKWLIGVRHDCRMGRKVRIYTSSTPFVAGTLLKLIKPYAEE
jgi:hypothetical protein